MPKRLTILAGEKYNRWTILNEIAKSGGNRYFLCKCECGKIQPVSLDNLRGSQSHGCRECYWESRRISGEGYSGTRIVEYRTWISLRSRCENKNDQRAYRYYGARGITVCDRWKSSFDNFFQDMGPRPSSKHSIDRKDPNGNYEPHNCQWATRAEQQDNRRNTIVLSFNGSTLSLRVWAEKLQIPYRVLFGRLAIGWSIEKTLSTHHMRKGEHNARFVEFNGRTQNITEWARELGMARKTIRQRLQRGLPIEQVLKKQDVWH